MSPVSLLTKEQAQRALLALFESVPAEVWQTGQKPSLGRLTNLVDKAEDEATGEALQAIGKLRDPGQAQIHGEVAKEILEDFYADAEWRLIVESALAGAMLPHMSQLPAELGSVLLTLAALAIRIKFVRSGGGKSGPTSRLDFEFSPLKAVDATLKLVKNLPTVFFSG